MNQEKDDVLYDLLTKKAIHGLDDAEQRHLDSLDMGNADAEFRSLEMTAAAIGMAGLGSEEPLPAHLRLKIMADAGSYVVDRNAQTMAWPPATDRSGSAYESEQDEKTGSWFGWLGWATAVAACIVLALNLWFTRVQPSLEVAENKPPVEAPRTPTAAEQRDQMMGTATDVLKATWAPGNVKGLTQMVGDVVWSDEKQTGYMRVRGLPVNDTTKETYQLWIYDKTRDDAHPIDGGVFDVSSSGEVVIPINAKLKAQHPTMFAITMEKPGGVVVSKGAKIAALATVETKTRSGA